MSETPVVNCVLLWARPGMEAELSAYEDKVLRLVAERDAAIARTDLFRIQPASRRGPGH
jgi:hypothetical protein